MLRIGETSFQRMANKPPVEIPNRWQGLIGEYGWDHNTLYILEEHGSLYALIEWFYYYPLEEISQNVFAFPDYGLYHGERLIFDRDSLHETAASVKAAEVVFERRKVGTADGETFKINPVKPISELRDEALAASPPEETSVDFKPSELVDLQELEPSIKLDIRYATTNNFTGSVFYQQPRAFLQRPAAEAVARVHRNLRPLGYGLLIHDAYRPWHVTKMFWDATPDALKDFVANPANGSRHNRGCAVDLSLYELKTGEPVQMVAGYDEFSIRSYPAYPGGTSRQRWFRELLRNAMRVEDFTVYEYEWWHFDYKDWRNYRIGNSTFEQLDPQ
jgi:D-alanyl-D-alanine dipeptidase